MERVKKFRKSGSDIVTNSLPDWMKGPHRRLNQLTGEWVIVSAQRAMRPWQGQMESAAQTQADSYDPACYLCPATPVREDTVIRSTNRPSFSIMISPPDAAGFAIVYGT